MGFLSDIASLMGASAGEENRPTSSSTQGYSYPTFNPALFAQILASLPGANVTGLYGYNMSYDPATGTMNMNTPGGSEGGPGGAYRKEMQDYISSTGNRLYNETILPTLQRRGVLSAPGGQGSREESLYARDWGTMMNEQAQKAGATSIGLEQQGQKDLMGQLAMALGVSQNALPLAAGKNTFSQSSYYY